MKKIMGKHFFFDGYSIRQVQLDNVGKIALFLENINKYFFENKGKIMLIPYFSGKVKEDGGISGIVLGDNKHFTCHTFCYKNTVFIDYFGVETVEDREKMSEEVLTVFETDDYDFCDNNDDFTGNFGKHIIIKPSVFISYSEATKLISVILKEIDMTPITDQIINYRDEENYDILQPIAESHISFHRVGTEMIIDVFSCKYFDEKKLVKILKHSNSLVQVNRGVKYK